jgi:hypothetical protein
MRETVTEFRLWLRLPDNAIGEVSASDAAVVKDVAQRMMNGGARFSPEIISPTGVTEVFHPSYQGGRAPLGYISPVEVPRLLSNELLLEHLKQAA